MKGRPDREGGGDEGKDGEQADRQRYVYPSIITAGGRECEPGRLH